MRSFVITVVLVALAVAGYIGARYWQSPPTAQLLNDGAACDLTEGDCKHAMPDGGSVVLRMSPRPVPLMHPVRISVQALDTTLLPAYLEITGLNMNMGLTRVPLQQGADGAWIGETIVPVCSRRHMQWQAALFLRSGRRLYRLNDEFDTLRP
jgi:hypothetical protein